MQFNLQIPMRASFPTVTATQQMLLQHVEKTTLFTGKTGCVVPGVIEMSTLTHGGICTVNLVATVVREGSLPVVSDSCNSQPGRNT